MTIQAWRIGAKTCPHRAYDGERLRARTGHKGNPLCAYAFIGMRCTRNLCPIKKKVETPPPGSQEDGR